MKTHTIVRNFGVAALFAAITSHVQAAHVAFVTSPLAVVIPGTSYDVKTRTLIGWLFAVTIVFLAIRAIMVSMSSADERSKEERDDKIKAAWIAFGSGLAIFAVLSVMGLVSLTDITSAISQF